MKIVSLTPPGRFPTVSADPGQWWNAASQMRGHQLSRSSANFEWWRAIIGPAVTSRLTDGITLLQCLRRRLEWSADQLDLRGGAEVARNSLDQLRQARTYASSDDYIEAVTRLTEYLDRLNRAQDEIVISFDEGPQVVGLNYDDSRHLAWYSTQQTLLSTLIQESLREFSPDVDLVVFSVTSAFELLTAMIIARILRERNPSVHLCLADHGYENFSLTPHIANLKESRTLCAVFDTIIESKDERDFVIPALISAIDSGSAPCGYITRDDFPDIAVAVHATFVAPPPLPTFAPEPVLWTRISGRRCYWSRCTFCVQNNKYDDRSAPSTVEVAAALKRIEAFLDAGYQTIIFSDEALSPSMLMHLSRGILQRGLKFRWACRSKFELAHTRELFEMMAAAGCFEVLYGLESISPRMQKLMGKYTKGLDADAIRSILKTMDEFGIGTHINLIGNFPGDSRDEVIETVEFLVDTLKPLRGATFLLNRFALFPETPVAKDPSVYGIAIEEPDGDMPSAFRYCEKPKQSEESRALDQLIPELRDRLLHELGWSTYGTGPGPRSAVSHYFGSGHGALFKSSRSNPFANPFATALAEVTS